MVIRTWMTRAPSCFAVPGAAGPWPLLSSSRRPSPRSSNCCCRGRRFLAAEVHGTSSIDRRDPPLREAGRCTPRTLRHDDPGESRGRGLSLGSAGRSSPRSRGSTGRCHHGRVHVAWDTGLVEHAPPHCARGGCRGWLRVSASPRRGDRGRGRLGPHGHPHHGANDRSRPADRREKSYVTNGGSPGSHAARAHARPRGARAHSLGLRPRQHAGVHVGREEDKLGIRGSSTVTVVLRRSRGARGSHPRRCGEGSAGRVRAL